MFPSVEEPAAAGSQACCRSVATVAPVAAAVAVASGESLDRFAARVFAGRGAADELGSAIVQNDGLALEANMASEPRALVAVSIHIALVARVDIPAATRDSLFVVKLQIPVAVPAGIVAVPIDIPAVVRVEISAAVPTDSAAALRAGLTFAPGGLVASGWALDDGGAAQSSGCDGPEREMAPLPWPALR
ncbi:MAG: hypothetical protein JWN74_3326 [Acidobacteriaceae bacterium]|nr:hypothetical protein [Acidobacteriaceae bacterium]